MSIGALFLLAGYPKITMLFWVGGALFIGVKFIGTVAGELFGEKSTQRSLGDTPKEQKPGSEK